MREKKKDGNNIFIDYTDADLPWVEWVVWHLEDAGYRVIYRKRDFRPGMNSDAKTHDALKKAKQVIIVLSPDYLKTRNTIWTAVPEGKLLPLLVRSCQPMGLLKPLIALKIVDLDESQARKVLLDGVSQEQPSNKEKPLFPGNVQEPPIQTRPNFPSRPLYWKVPPENPLFTDREDELTTLYKALHSDQQERIHRHVINGLGGIGKTQVALAYAHEYRHHYKAVLWINASNEQTLLIDFVQVAKVLKLNLSRNELRNMQDLQIAIKDWLENHEGWLLIFDNIGDIRSLHGTMPSLGSGHILFTARTQIVGATISSASPLAELKSEDGALFLLKRASPGQNNAEYVATNQAEAYRLSGMLGDLPLMLDQAGAYIEDTGIDVSRYLEWYSDNTWKHMLLGRRGNMTVDHLEPVIETWESGFVELQRVSPAAYNLLQLCAFVHHKNIPEEIVSKGAAEILPMLQIFAHPSPLQAEAFAALRKYSLLSLDANTGSFSLNRMVQEVIKDKMSREERHAWAERAIVVVARAFLNNILPDTLMSYKYHCPRYFPHVRICVSHMQEWDIMPTEGPQLLYQMGTHLYYYVQAYPELPAQEKLEHKYIVEALDCYATLLKNMNHLAEANELIAHANKIQANNAAMPNIY